MEQPIVFFLPLDDETRQCAVDAQEHWDKTYYWLLRSDPEHEEPIGLEFLNIDAAEAASVKIAEFRNLLTRLDLYVPEQKRKPTYLIESQRANNLDPANQLPAICIPYDEFFHGEFGTVLEMITPAVLHYIPIHEKYVSFLKAYLQTFELFEIFRYICLYSQDDREWFPTHRDLHSFHSCLLKLARRVVSTILDTRPINLNISGSSKKLEITVNGNVLGLSAKQIRGVVALALMEYNHWFFVDDFCKLAFPDDVYEPRKQFDAALSVLKKWSPFGWDADEGLRRIKGTVIKSEVDKTVLQAHLGQKTAL